MGIAQFAILFPIFSCNIFKQNKTIFLPTVPILKFHLNWNTHILFCLALVGINLYQPYWSSEVKGVTWKLASTFSKYSKQGSKCRIIP